MDKAIKTALKYFQDEKLGRERIVAVCWVAFALCMGAVASCYAQTLIWDDTYFCYEKFPRFQDEKGFFGAIIAFFLNMDIAHTGEFRTYGLSKAIHFILHQFVGDRAYIYQFIITSTHIISGILVYKLLKKLKVPMVTTLFVVAVYSINPFTVAVQSFHHFSYLLLPLYFVLLYTYFEVNNISTPHTGELSSWKYVLIHLRSFLLIFCTVFTGESALGILGTVIVLLIAHGIATKNRRTVLVYCGHLAVQAGLLLTWIFTWNHFIVTTAIKRFSFKSINWSAIPNFFTDIFKAIRRYLYLDEYVPLSANIWESFSYPIFFLLILLFVGMMLGFIFLYNSRKENANMGSKTLMVISLFIASSFGVYFLMCVGTGFAMIFHYFYTLLMLLSILLIVWLSVMLQKKFFIFFASIIVSIFCIYNIIWYAALMPDIGKQTSEIISNIEHAKLLNKDSVIVVTDSLSPNGSLWDANGTVLFEHNVFSPVTVFTEQWTAGHWPFDSDRPRKGYLYSNFENVLFIGNASSQIVDQLDSDFLIVTAEGQEHKIHKDNVFIMTTTDLEGVQPKYRTMQKRFYFSYEEYLNSPSYNGLAVYSGADGYNKNHHLLTGKTYIAVNSGVTVECDGYFPDKNYEHGEMGEIGYGSLGGASAISFNPVVEYLGNYIANVRYGREFSYKFSELPEDEKLAVYVDLYDYWKRNPDERVFDIKVETDQNTFVIEDVDPYLLSVSRKVSPWIYVNRNDLIKDSTFMRIAINLPKTTQVTLTFSANENMPQDSSSTPFVHGMGIISY